MKILYWKCVGGYLLVARLKGRWYYVGSTEAENRIFHAFMKERGFELERVQGIPQALTSVWKKYGATVKALKDNLPFWKNGLGKKGGEENDRRSNLVDTL